MKDCAGQLGVARHKIVYAYESGKVPAVKVWVGGRRVFTARDLKQLADYFGIDCDSANETGEKNE